MLVRWCHQLLSVFLANGLLLRVPRQSRLSTNEKGDKVNKLGDHLMKAVRPSHRLKAVPFSLNEEIHLMAADYLMFLLLIRNTPFSIFGP